MPLLDFECANEHIFERYYPLAEVSRGMKVHCHCCKARAVRVYLTQHQSRNAKTFEPSVFFEKDGELFVGGTNDPRDLKGYDKTLLAQGYKEIRIENYRQYEQFQRSHSQALKQKHQAEIEQNKQLYSQAIQQNIDDIKQGYTWEKPVFNSEGKHIGSEKVQIPPLHRLEPQSRALAEKAIEEMRNTSNMQSLQERDQRPYIDSFENDRPKQEDERGGSKWF